MAIITLSWQLGCLGDLVADEAANQLGYKVFGKPEIDALLAQHDVQLSKGTGDDKFVQAAGEEIQPEAFERLRRNHTTYVHLLTSSIYHIASQDQAVIKGHGAQIVLAHQAHVLRIRLTGSFDFRVSKAREQQHLSQSAAEELVRKDDRERMGLIRYLFQDDSSNQNWYDMRIDVEKFAVNGIAETIVSAARALEAHSPTTEDDRSGLGALALANLVKAVLHKEMPFLSNAEVIASTGGIVTIYGNVALLKEKDRVERRIRSLPKVSDVVNNIKVLSLLT